MKGNMFTAKTGEVWRQCTLACKHGSQSQSRESLEAPLAVEAPAGICQVPPNSPSWGSGKSKL